MQFNEVMRYLEDHGSEQTRKIFKNHGATDNLFGVKVGDMKVIQKKIKTNHALAEELYATGNSDAQYFAGLIADPKAFSKSDFERWANQATWYMISEYAFAWNLSESPLCIAICKEWINSDNIKYQECAWAAMNAYFSVTPNDQIDIPFHKSLLNKIEKEIHSAPNRVKYCMNGYVIALGAAIPELTQLCKEVGKRIGKVEVFMGATSCKVPDIGPYLTNIEARGRIGNKKKTSKC